MSVAIGSGGGGVGATAAGPAGFAGCCGCAAWAFGFGFELHAVTRKTTTAATGHHARVVMLGAPPSRISGLALTRNCKPGALKRSPPAPPCRWAWFPPAYAARRLDAAGTSLAWAAGSNGSPLRFDSRLVADAARRFCENRAKTVSRGACQLLGQRE